MVPVTIDKSRNLQFDLDTFCDLEQKTGIPSGSLIQSFANISLTAIVYALWAGLKHEDAALSPNLMKKILETYMRNGGSLKVLADALSLAIMESGLFNGIDADVVGPVEAPATEAQAERGRKRKRVA